MQFSNPTSNTIFPNKRLHLQQSAFCSRTLKQPASRHEARLRKAAALSSTEQQHLASDVPRDAQRGRRFINANTSAASSRESNSSANGRGDSSVLARDSRRESFALQTPSDPFRWLGATSGLLATFADSPFAGTSVAGAQHQVHVKTSEQQRLQQQQQQQ